MRTKHVLFLISIIWFIASCASKPRRAEILFVGHGIEHISAYANWTSIELFKRGINTTFTQKIDELDADYLNKFDGMVLFADDIDLSEDKDKMIQDFVHSGKGLIVFSTSGNTLPSSSKLRDYLPREMEKLEGGETTITVNAEKFDGETLSSFTVHSENYNFQAPEGIEVIAEADGGKPYIWMKDAGKGKVLYSAIGREESTWKNLSFLKIIRNGSWWVLNDDVKKLVNELAIPEVSIYGDTISDFTARHDVPKMQEALSPEESMKLIQNPVDFELKLFASEPDIVNPIAMSWDEKGRLWVIETTDYPNDFKDRPEEGNDKIIICEDTTGDGVADKFTVFADSLNIATSLTFVNDGVLVATAPYFIFMKDTDGDDVVDLRDTIMTGWKKDDTHAGPSNLQYGFDNKVYGVTGFAGFDGEINGKRENFSNGVYSFNPDGSDFKFLAHTSNNTWGLGFSEDNNMFISTANNTHSAFYSMGERHLQRRVEGLDAHMHVDAVHKIDGHYEVHALTPNLRQVDVVGGFTSAAGHQMYTARDYPKEYWNRVGFVTEPTVRLVHNAIIEKDGAGFKEEDGWNLLASTDEWFGPIHAEVGPDGAVWVLDWYNFIIQHNVFVPEQAPSEKVLPFVDQPHGPGNAFSSDLRDKKHGRVYRVVYKDGKHKENRKLSKDNPNGLIDALKSQNKFWRMHAQRLLVERKNDDVKGKLIAIIEDKNVDEIGLNAPAIHAIWTLQGLGLLTGDEKSVNTVIAALKHPSAGVRKAAVQALEITSGNIGKVISSGIFQDDDLNTRLAAFVKLAEIAPLEQAARELEKVGASKVDISSDRWLSAAYFAALQNHAAYVDLAKLTSGSSDYLTKVARALEKETYRIGRRVRLQFSPRVQDKDLSFETNVSRRDNEPYNGLIVGQGNSKNGYALYMINDELIWEVYQNGQKQSVATRSGVSSNFKLQATLTQDGGGKIIINDKEVASNEQMKPFSSELDLFLRSGHDLDGKFQLADYKGSHEFTGNTSDIDISFKTSGLELSSNQEPVADPEVSQVESDETIVLKAVKDLMQYDIREFHVKAGSTITLVFENPDGMPHNLLLIEPGTLEIVGEAADKMLRYSSAAEMEYVPDVPEVLHHTPLVNPGESATLTFKVPEKKGEYPYVCTFPGHWRGMNGKMIVE